jgi:hypothetical protein
MCSVIREGNFASINVEQAGKIEKKIVTKYHIKS